NYERTTGNNDSQTRPAVPPPIAIGLNRRLFQSNGTPDPTHDEEIHQQANCQRDKRKETPNAPTAFQSKFRPQRLQQRSASEARKINGYIQRQERKEQSIKYGERQAADSPARSAYVTHGQPAENGRTERRAKTEWQRDDAE